MVFAVLVLAGWDAAGGDWPQFLGPTRNGVCAETNLNLIWSGDGPPKLWQKDVGQGFSGPAVSGGSLILFHRLGDRETVECLDPLTGTDLWKYDYPTAYRDDFGFDEGPRATPAIADGKVFVYGAAGALHCLNLSDGRLVWEVDCQKKFGSRKGYFGRVCSPLVEGDKVILNVGGNDGSGIVAFNKETGKLVWKATEEEASYSSPVAATIGGKRYLFVFTRSGLAALDPEKGGVYFQFPWRSPIDASVNAATPLVIGDSVFLSASYDTGAILLRIAGGRPEKIWSGEDALDNHYATSVYHDGYFYGFNGRQESGPSLNCVESRTGKVAWSQPGFGAGSMLLAGDRLVILTEKGELIAAGASSKEFKVVSRAQVLAFESRAYPALANGLFFARSKRQMICLDLRKPRAAPAAR
jgi:outer membrane protein assembly factor BamB